MTDILRNPYANADLGRASVGQRVSSHPIPAPPGAPGSVGEFTGAGASLLNQPPGTIGFDRIDRFSYAAPPTAGQTFLLFAVPQDITKGLITGVGVGSPQIDWFGANEYQFQLNGSPPYDQQLAASGNILSANSFYGFLPLGTLQNPKQVRIQIVPTNLWQVKIRPQSTPQANVVVYNVFVRTVGYFYR